MRIYFELDIINNPNETTEEEIKNALWEKCADYFETGDNFSFRNITTRINLLEYELKTKK